MSVYLGKNRDARLTWEVLNVCQKETCWRVCGLGTGNVLSFVKGASGGFRDAQVGFISASWLSSKHHSSVWTSQPWLCGKYHYEECYGHFILVIKTVVQCCVCGFDPYCTFSPFCIAEPILIFLLTLKGDCFTLSIAIDFLGVRSLNSRSCHAQF